MRENPIKDIYFGQEVYVNPTTESLRESECLCLNCGNLKPGQSDNCHIAQALYQICVKENVAFPITRCPIWKPKA